MFNNNTGMFGGATVNTTANVNPVPNTGTTVNMGNVGSVPNPETQQAKPKIQINSVIKQILLIPTREHYKDIYQRSYKFNATAATLNKAEVVFEKAGVADNGIVPEITLGNELPELVGINANVTGKAEIPNGWGTQRLRFVIVVETPYNGQSIATYIQGFTEYHDPSMSGRIDPNMKFYINSITNVVRMINPTTGALIVQPQATFNVITDMAGGRRYEEVLDMSSDLETIRPVDIFTKIYAVEKYGDANVQGNATTLGGKVTTSKRANANPIKWVSSVLNNYIEAKSTASLSYDTADVIKAAKSPASEPAVLSTPFIYELSQVTGEVTPTSFTLNVLNMMNPGIESKLKLIEKSQQGYMETTNTVLDTNDTADMLQPTFETMTANLVASGITSLMMDNLVTKLDIHMSNASGENVVIVTDINSFIEGINLIRYTNNIINYVKTTLMPVWTHSGMLMLTIKVSSKLTGDTTVAVSVNGQPDVVYRFPSFADSLYTPIITDKATAASTVDDFTNLLDVTYKVADSNQILY